MTALTINAKLPIRGGSQFGYSVASGIHAYAGALLMFNAAGTLQRIQDAGGVAFAGLGDREVDNTTGANTAFVIPQRGIVARMAVPGAVFANVGAPVYATDDATCTLASNSGANPQVGFLAGFESGATWVRIVP